MAVTNPRRSANSMDTFTQTGFRISPVEDRLRPPRAAVFAPDFARRLVIASIALAFAALVHSFELPSANAQVSEPIRHKVVRGDTLELLAAEYYGSRRHAIFIMKANRLTHSRPLKVGETLKVPIARVLTVKVGDTLKDLAKQHLGDERRAPFLAAFNNLEVVASLAAGASITVPFHVVHRADTAVSVVDLSLAYFGDKSLAKRIRDYNFLPSDEIAAGKTVIIPIIHVKVREGVLPKPDKESQALVQKRIDEQEKARDRLSRAAKEWRKGDYRDVIELLTRIETEYLDAREAIAIGVLLGSAYVATGDNATAVAEFEKALERRRGYKLDPYYHSPKIIKVWEQAGGGVKSRE